MGERILLIEDDEYLCELMTLVFELEGYEVIAAAHGGAAMEQIRESPPDVIVSDLMMPVIDGIQFARWLRQEAKLDIPLLIVTSRGNRATEEDVLAAGANAVLFKPIAKELLLERIGALLGS